MIKEKSKNGYNIPEDRMTTICHFPSSGETKYNKAHSMKVPKAALDVFLSYGDYEGECVNGKQSTRDDSNRKVIICHVPPGNPQNSHTLKIDKSALNAHLAKGDYVGPCTSNGSYTTPTTTGTIQGVVMNIPQTTTSVSSIQIIQNDIMDLLRQILAIGNSIKEDTDGLKDTTSFYSLRVTPDTRSGFGIDTANADGVGVGYGNVYLTLNCQDVTQEHCAFNLEGLQIRLNNPDQYEQITINSINIDEIPYVLQNPITLDGSVTASNILLDANISSSIGIAESLGIDYVATRNFEQGDKILDLDVDFTGQMPQGASFWTSDSLIGIT
jgi:hypothetical protein